MFRVNDLGFQGFHSKIGFTVWQVGLGVWGSESGSWNSRKVWDPDNRNSGACTWLTARFPDARSMYLNAVPAGQGGMNRHELPGLSLLTKVPAHCIGHMQIKLLAKG